MKNSIFRLILLINVSFYFAGNLFSQNYSMSDATINTCGGTFYDPGGSGGDYGNNDLFTMTFCSDQVGDELMFTFTEWLLEGCCDFLTIYDGATTGDPQIYTGDGADPTPGVVTSTSGCLTFTWDSDGSVIDPGWTAIISCFTPSCTDGIQNGDETLIDCGGPSCPPCSDVVISDGGTVNTCSGSFYDAGGLGNYDFDENYITTICSGTADQITVDFTGLPFGLQANNDVLYIFDGVGTGGTATWESITGNGIVNPGAITSTTGCLTFEFISDGVTNNIGWEALISCPTCTDGIQNGNEQEVDCGGPTCTPCPNCFNGIQDGTETGIDCGPNCPNPCHCGDGILNGDETGIDCGGSCFSCPTPCEITLTATTGSYDPPVVAGPDYTMSNGTINTCAGTFFDPGGTGNYGVNDVNTQTFCSDIVDGQIQFDFTVWDLETCCDVLTIYDGPDATGAVLFSDDGSSSPGIVVSTDGCLTFSWDSDGSVQNPGWEATISCVNVPLPFDCNGGEVILTAEGQGEFVFVLNNDFDDGSAGSGWNTNITADYSNPCDPSLDGGTYMWMGNSAPHPRTIQTVPLDLSCGGEICFFLDFATQGNASPCEGIDEPDEGVFLEYSLDGGTSFVTMEYYGPAGVGNNTTAGGTDPQMTAWNQYCFTIPPAASAPGVIFQWAQTGSSGLGNDHWGLDNVTIAALQNCDPYVYDYTDIAGGDNGSVQNETITETTTYTVLYTNGTDTCSASIEVVVPPGTTADAGVDQVICGGGTGVVIGADPVTPDDGADYLWSSGAGGGVIALTGGSPDNGQVTVNPAVTTDYYLEITFNGCTTFDTVTVVVDAPPTASDPAPINVECIANVPAPDITLVIDELDDVTLAPVVAWVDDVSDNGTCPEVITRTYSVSDDCGNEIFVTQTITVNDVTPPTASDPLGQVGTPPAPDPAVVTDEADNCGVPIVAFVEDVSDGGNCPEIIIREYSVTDSCGNTISVFQTFTVGDAIFPTASDPVAINVECVGEIPVPDVNVVIDEADNGAVAPTVTWEDDTSDGLTCPETILRRYKIEDNCGNFIFVTQTITIFDVTDPTASDLADQSGTPTAPNIADVTDAADNCGAPVVAFVADISDGGDCPEIITREYTVTDACGNSISVFQTFSIGDPDVPTASNPAPIVEECIGDVPVPDVAVVTDEADNGAIPIVTWEDDISDNGTCPEIITRRYRVTDDCGNFIFVSQTITVNDITMPTASNLADINVECIGDVPVENILDVFDEADNCTAAPIVAFVSDASDGNACPETITRTYSVTDDCGNQILVTQAIIVNDVTAPTASNLAVVNVECIGDVPAQNSADVFDEADNCTATPIVVFVGDVSDGATCPETITRTYSVTDDCGNEILVTQMITVNDITDPTATDPVTTIVPGGPAPAADITLVIDAADNCTVAPVVAFVSESTDGVACPETITRIYSVTDDCGNSINVTHIITITDPFPPTATNPTPINVECIGDVPAWDILVVTDEADNQGVPVVAFVSDVSNGATCPEVIIRTYSVTDVCANEILVTQTITVNDITLPTASNLVDVNVECIGDVPAQNSADVFDEADNCTAAPIVAFVSDASDGNACPETITRTYSVTDDCGNQILVTQAIIVNDVTAPTASNLVAVNVECVGDVPAQNILDINDEADNCTAAPIVAFVGDVSDGATCPETITRTYSVTDDCGNETLITQIITVNDITKPSASNLPPLSVPGAVDVPAENINDVNDEADNCTLNPVVEFVNDLSDGNVCNGEIITRTYSVTDDCGNFILVTQQITIEAVTPPISIDDETICLGESVTLTADNPSNADISWDQGIQDGVQFTPSQTLIYTVTAEDNGCFNTASSTVTVEENPVASFTASDPGCEPLTVTFTNTSTSNSSLLDCQWDIEGAGNSFSGCGIVDYHFPVAGVYDVTLTITSQTGCTDSVTYTDFIDVYELPVASFIASQTTLSTLNTEVDFTNTSTGAASYDWSFGDSTSNANSINATHTFPSEEAGGYVVTLIATSEMGCIDTTTAIITVQEELIYYIPNTFTPDGDEYNNTFHPVFTSGYDPFDYNMVIYNRWGEMIFESNDSNFGWDGTYNGKLIQDGTYSWEIEFKLVINDKRVVINGHVNILR